MLITPPYHSGVVESAGTWLNLGFVYIAGSLRNAGYDVEIYDAMSYFHTYDEIIIKIQTSKPDVVATTAITASINDCVEVCKLSKKINPEIVTILGNVHSYIYVGGDTKGASWLCGLHREEARVKLRSRSFLIAIFPEEMCRR